MPFCYECGFWDSDREGCTCASYEMWYACPIESAKPENQKELEAYAKYIEEREVKQNDMAGNSEHGTG